jgi:hypothetical protein
VDLERRGRGGGLPHSLENSLLKRLAAGLNIMIGLVEDCPVISCFWAAGVMMIEGTVANVLAGLLSAPLAAAVTTTRGLDTDCLKELLQRLLARKGFAIVGTLK